MSNKWKVSSNYMGAEKCFQVYRMRNINETDHLGNREYYGGIVTDRTVADSIAEKLNLKNDDKKC